MRLLLILAFLPVAGRASSDWLQFRGPGSSGNAGEGSNPPRTFEGADGVAWKAALPGRGLSSPLVSGGRVFVTAASGPKQERLHVLCFGDGDGKLIWEREFRATGRTMCHAKTCNAAPTPCSDGKHVYALFSSNDLICLDMEGNLVWLRGLMVDYPNAGNSLGLASSPVMAGGVVVAQIENDSDSFTAGIDAGTGEQYSFDYGEWEFHGAAAAWEGACGLAVEGGDDATGAGVGIGAGVGGHGESGDAWGAVVCGERGWGVDVCEFGGWGAAVEVEAGREVQRESGDGWVDVVYRE